MIFEEWFLNNIKINCIIMLVIMRSGLLVKIVGLILTVVKFWFEPLLLINFFVYVFFFYKNPLIIYLKINNKEYKVLL